MSTCKVGDLLKGCKAGRTQTVGYLSVIPLTSELQDDRFAAPTGVKIKTKTYGHLVFNNTKSKPILIPAGTTYMVDQAAQNHALPHAGWAKAKASAEFTTAMCIQQSQGGAIAEGEHTMMLLPVSLREQAHILRKEKDFSRLWPAIADFNRQAGLVEHGNRGHLEHFFSKFKDDLDGFVAQFEPVPGQVGAIVLVNGRVVGVERCPSSAYFLDVWRPLIRECYGSLALIEAAKNPRPTPPATRVPLRRVTSLDDLGAALDEAEASERAKVSALVASVLGMNVACATDEQGELTRESVDSPAFAGQAIRDGESVLYVSLIARSNWKQRSDWMTAEAFSM